MSFTGCKPGDPCWDLGYIFNDVLPPSMVSGMEELYGCGINPYSFIDCNVLTGCTSVLSGLTGPYITGATYDSTTGCLTFYRQSGATFSACGFLTGATSTSSSSYWSAGTRGITYTGGSSTYVGVGTEDPNKTLTVKGSMSATTTLDVDGNTTLSTQLNISGNTVTSGNISLTQDSYLYFGYDVNNQTYIREDGNNLVIDANDDILLRPDDDLKIAVGSTQYAVFDGAKTSLIIGSTGVPTSRLTIDSVQPSSVQSFDEANTAGCIAMSNFMDIKSGSVDGATLCITEKRIGGAGEFFIFPNNSSGEGGGDGDLVFGAFKSGESCARELIRLDGSTARVGIKNASPSYDLDVVGSSNADTLYSAGTDLYGLIKIIGEGVVSVGRWSGGTQGIIYTGGSSTFVGIGTSVPNKELTVIGGISGTSTLNINGNSYLDGALSIGYNDPKVKLDVHHNPTDLANNTGGGESITFGIESSHSLSAGTLMWLHTDGYWYNADADNVVSGATNLIAIALGTAVSDGMLIRGFYDYSSNLQGTFAKGMPCYVSENAGFVDFTAPSGSADYVRILGYGTDTANIIYFNPDKTWVELS